ncbi:MAG: hypothetical protein QG629_665 [Patescibacteria group bacterium]|nr:hypothetical protein [Patescibacteria group bacterium]
MAQKTKNSSTSKILVALVGVLVVFGVLLFLEKTDRLHLFHNHPGPSKQQQEQEHKANAEKKQSYLDQAYGKNPEQPEKGSASSGDTTPSPSSVEISTKQNGSSVLILAKMQNVPTGTCKLSVTNGSQSIAQSAKIIYQPEFSSCAGFTVPVSGLGTGDWSVVLEAQTDGGQILTSGSTAVTVIP